MAGTLVDNAFYVKLTVDQVSSWQNFHIRWSNGYFFYCRKHPNTSLHLFVIYYTIVYRLRAFRKFFLEKMWFCHLFSKYDIFKRSLNSLNYCYLIFLSRISTRFILHAFLSHFYSCLWNKTEMLWKRDFFYRTTFTNSQFA